MIGFIFSKVIQIFTILALVLYHVTSVLFIFIVHVIVVIALPFLLPFHFVKILFEGIFEKERL